MKSYAIAETQGDGRLYVVVTNDDDSTFGQVVPKPAQGVDAMQHCFYALLERGFSIPGFFIGQDGVYYTGKKRGYTDTVVPVRPSPDYDWDGAAWTLQTSDTLGGRVVDKMDRLAFEVALDMENRMRVREGKATITRVQYRIALINAWKAIP